MLFMSIAVPKPWTLQDIIWVILCHFPLCLGAASLELQLSHGNCTNGPRGEGRGRVRHMNDRNQPPFPAREKSKRFSWSLSWCLGAHVQPCSALERGHLSVFKCFGPKKQTTSILRLSIREGLTRTSLKHSFSRRVPLSDVLPLFCWCWWHEEWERVVTCGINILKTAPAQVLDGTRQHRHRPAGWELQRVWEKQQNPSGSGKSGSNPDRQLSAQGPSCTLNP